MKKTGLGRDPLSWITDTAEKPKVERGEEKIQADRQPKGMDKEKESIPKFQTFDIRLTSLLREDQLEFLEKLVRDIKKSRTAEFRKERITKNSIMRAFIDAFMDTDIDVKNIPDETVLRQRVAMKIRR